MVMLKTLSVKKIYFSKLPVTFRRVHETFREPFPERLSEKTPEHAGAVDS